MKSKFNSMWRVAIALVMVLSLSLVMAVPVSAAPDVDVTAATGGDAISADTAVGALGEDWTDLGPITIAEQADSDIAKSQTDVTLVLKAPAGFQFNSGQEPSISSDGTEVTAATIVITASLITVTFTTSAVVGTAAQIVIGDTTEIQVQPTSGTPLASGQIYAPTTGLGSATITGIVDTDEVDGEPGVATNFGTLGMIPGALDEYLVEPEAGPYVAGTAFDVVITAVDQFANPLGTAYTTDEPYSWITTAVNAPDLTEPEIGTLEAADFTDGVATKSVTLYKAESGVTFTATDATAPTGTSAGITVDNAPHAAYTVDPDALIRTAGTPFTVTITAVDEFENAATVPDIDATLDGYTFTLSGPSDAPDGTEPTYGAVGAFASGVSTLSVTLVKVETVALTVGDDQTVPMSGTSATVFVEGINLDSEGYRTDATVTVTVGDEDLAGVGTTGIVASGTVPINDVSVALTETPAVDGIFVGTFTLVDTSPGSGELLVGEGSTITVTYPTDDTLEVSPLNVATVDNTSPTFTSVEDGDFYKNTDEISLTVTLVEAGLIVTADFSNIDSEYTTGDEESTGGPIYAVTYTISADNTIADGEYVIPVTATDVAGNSATNTSFFTTLDNTEPVVDNEVPADESFIDDSTPLFSVEVTDSSIDYEAWTMVIDSIGDVTADLSVSPITDGYLLEYLVSSANELDEGLCTWTVTATDLALNEGTAEFTFTYDASAPELDAAVTGWTWDAEAGAAGEPADTNSRTSIMVIFSEDLDEATVEASDFLVADLVTPSAIEVQDLLVFLTITEMATDATPSVELVGEVSDTAGNAQTEGLIEAAEDDIDPILAIVVNPDPCGVDDVTLTLSFSEAMNVLVPPTVTFTPEGLGAVTVTGAWNTSTEWQGTEAVTDAMEGVAAISVTAAQDILGNTMVADIDDTFTIDTSVADPTFSPTGSIYNASPVVRVIFSEEVTINAALFGGEEVLADLTTTDNMTYELTTEDLATGGYIISVEAEDALGNTGGPFEGTFTVESAVASYDIELCDGWNLISLPLIPDDPDITAVISTDTLASGDVSSVGIVRGYDPTTGDFPLYIPATGGELTEMRDGCGYWVFMNAADTLTVTGRTMPGPEEVPPFYDVVVGWNLIGFKSLDPMTDWIEGPPDTGYLVNIVGIYPVLWSYDAQVGAYSNVKDVTDGMEVGHGFWLWATQAGTIVPSQ